MQRYDIRELIALHERLYGEALADAESVSEAAIVEDGVNA